MADKVVVFGANGMVGSRVVELLQKDFIFTAPDEKRVDITKVKALRTYLSKQKPQIVINFAAITDVDACERERENKNGRVWKVNALAPRFLSKLSRERNFFLVHISTDMVFPGTKEDPEPYSETHSLGKDEELTWYGASKAEGERGVLEENESNAVVRIIYPVRESFLGKLDYIRKILKLYDEGKLYPMFTDQYMNVTYIDELADALKVVAERRLGGIYHVATSNMTTPYELASYLLEKTREATDAVQESSFEEFIQGKDRRRYPEFGGLGVEETQEKLGLTFSPWKEVVRKLTPSLKKR